jgi:hypothetical protein
MNDAVIIAVANAITAQAEVLKSLIDALPKDTKAAVEKKVAKATPKVEEKAINETVTPVVVETTTTSVVETVTPAVVVPATPVGNGMPPAPFPTVAPAPIPVAPPQATLQSVTVSAAPVSASPSSVVPFTEAKGMMKYVMDAYQAMGQTKGAKIQDVLKNIGIKNINEVQPNQYLSLYEGVEALKNSN